MTMLGQSLWLIFWIVIAIWASASFLVITMFLILEPILRYFFKDSIDRILDKDDII